MKKNIAKAVWVMIVIISIILIVFAVFMNIFKMSAYYSYPRAEANVLEVRNYERRSDGQDTKYGSSVHVEYSVLGEKVNSWMTYDRYSTLLITPIIQVIVVKLMKKLILHSYQHLLRQLSLSHGCARRLSHHIKIRL